MEELEKLRAKDKELKERQRREVLPKLGGHLDDMRVLFEVSHTQRGTAEEALGRARYLESVQRYHAEAERLQGPTAAARRPITRRIRELERELRAPRVAPALPQEPQNDLTGLVAFAAYMAVAMSGGAAIASLIHWLVGG